MALAGLAEAQWAMYSNTNDKTWADKAMQSNNAALQLEPDRPAVRYAAGITLFRIGRYRRMTRQKSPRRLTVARWRNCAAAPNAITRAFRNRAPRA